MIAKTVAVSLDYASFYIAGSPDVDVPMEYDAPAIFGSEDCLVVTCVAWNEGETKITLAHYEDLAQRSGPPEVDRLLLTAEHRILLFDVNMPEILSMPVPGTRTRVRIWTNHPIQPDEIVIGLG